MSTQIPKDQFNLVIWIWREITDGIPVFDQNGNELGNSAAAAKSGITAVTISRVAMAAPAFGIPI